MHKRSKFLNTPPGSKPFYIEESIFRNKIEKKLGNFFEKCGFLPIETPLMDYFEPYYDIFNDEQSRNCIRFINRDGDLVLLRNDITLFGSKFIASRISDNNKIFRYYYSDSIIKSVESGNVEEYHQIGCEIVGDNFINEEIQILLILLESSSFLEIENSVLHIGDVSFYQNLFSNNMNHKNLIEVLKLIRRRDFINLKEKLIDLSINNDIIEDCIKVSSFIGGLEDLKKINISKYCKKNLDYIISIGDRLHSLGYKDDILFDMTELPHLDYYSGIIFHIYSKGIEVPIASGGRYDILFEKLGIRKNAIGFSYWLYPLEKILNKKTKKDTNEKEKLIIKKNSLEDFYNKLKIIKTKENIFFEYE